MLALAFSHSDRQLRGALTYSSGNTVIAAGRETLAGAQKFPPVMACCQYIRAADAAVLVSQYSEVLSSQSSRVLAP